MTTNAIEADINWRKACFASDVPENGGVCVLIDNIQIAIFNFSRTKEWYATQNLCPHRQQMALSRGMIGSSQDMPKVACPFHKKTFSLKSGECMSGDCEAIKVYQIKEENGVLLVAV
jgi:nitrite reductase (NADH) small subunit